MPQARWKILLVQLAIRHCEKFRVFMRDFACCGAGSHSLTAGAGEWLCDDNELTSVCRCGFSGKEV
jgi:hypothetical protein